MDPAKNIVIVGGGFAGTTLARALDGKLPDGYELVLVSEESYTTFNPMLPEALGASVFPEQVVAPIRQMLPRTRFIIGARHRRRHGEADADGVHARGRAQARLRTSGARVGHARAARSDSGMAEHARSRDVDPLPAQSVPSATLAVVHPIERIAS